MIVEHQNEAILIRKLPQTNAKSSEKQQICEQSILVWELKLTGFRHSYKHNST